MAESAVLVPREFVWRRVHSLTGLWLVIFLCEHLLTNSQAALFFGDDGNGFVRGVNFLHNLPYLQLIEVVLLGVPFLLHIVWGVRYAIQAHFNAHKTDGSKPMLKRYGRNRAYSWQRFTSWIVLIGLIAHVSFMRFYDYPNSASVEGQKSYFTRLEMDSGLYTLAARLGVKLYDQQMISREKQKLSQLGSKIALVERKVEDIDKRLPSGFKQAEPIKYSDEDANVLMSAQRFDEEKRWVEALEYRSITSTQVIAVAGKFGDALLLNVRDTFKSPINVVLYTIFVLATCFHAFNGLWTFCISWGVILRMRSQKRMVNVCVTIMVLIALLGLASIWGTYWVNLKS
ncbi:MAG: succinate dehydrogenase [Simkaniaceae bacterium]|nr:succinate dehydrogenase [Simkaniaceae bacterium]